LDISRMLYSVFFLAFQESIQMGERFKREHKYGQSIWKMGPIWNARGVEFVQLDKEKSLG
jgi:hypothetical protein